MTLRRFRWLSGALAAASALVCWEGPAAGQTLIINGPAAAVNRRGTSALTTTTKRTGLHIEKARTISFNYNLTDGKGFRWDIQSYGTVGSGTNSAYSGGMYLHLDNNNPRKQGEGWINREGDEVEIGPYFSRQNQSIQIHRRIKVYKDEGLARWLDIIQNTSGTAVSTQVRIYCSFSWNLTQTITNSGGGSFGEKDWAIITVTGAGMNSNVPSVLHVMGDKRSKLRPRVQLQGNQLYLYYDLTIPAKGTVILCHFESQNQSVDVLKKMMEGFKAQKMLKDLSPQVRKLIVNLSAGGGYADIDLERSESADTVIVGDDDPIFGTVQNKSYSVQTLLGKLDLPAEQVVGMAASVAEEDSVRFLLADGQVVCGRSPDTKLSLKLPSGGQLAIPVAKIKSWSYRISKQRPEEPTDSGPVVILRTQDQLAFNPKLTQFEFHTRYGVVKLKGDELKEIVLDNPANGVHQAHFLNGSRLAGLLEPEKVVLSLKLGQKLEVPRSLISRIRFALEENDTESSCHAVLSNEDELMGQLADEQITLATDYGTVQLKPGTIKTFQFTAGYSGRLAVELWDGSVLRGRLAQKELSFRIKPGPTLAIPVGQIVAIARSGSLPPEEIRKRVEELVARLGAESFKEATEELNKMGPAIVPLLEKYLSDSDPEVRQRIQSVLEALGWKGSSANSSPPRAPGPRGLLIR